MRQTEKNALLKELKPIFAHLLEKVASINYDKAAFCVQCGSKYPTTEKEGLLVIGRAVNGWYEASDADELLKSLETPEPLKWVEDDAGSTTKYNPNRSAFWRVIKGVAKFFYPQEWYAHIAWSNLCKIAPYEGGNPNNTLYYAQLKECQEILESEINILTPKAVLMLTGYNWAKDFLTFLNGNIEPKCIFKAAWSRYECKVYVINGTHYIVTEHPQGKKEAIHKECIIDILKKQIKQQ